MTDSPLPPYARLLGLRREGKALVMPFQYLLIGSPGRLHGGTVAGRMLIPLLPGRIGPKRFRQVIDGLMRSGNAFFVEKNGRVLLMAENLRENTAQLNRFKRAERERSGVKRLQRGQEIPIAVLVRRVDLKRRFDLAAGVQGALPKLAAAIGRELDKL